MRARCLTAASIAALVVAGWASGCGESADEPGSAAGGTGGLPDAGSDVAADGQAEADAPPVEAGPTTEAYDPCATATCWSAPALGACGSTSLSQSFSSGLYGVHRYLLMAPAGVEIELTAKRTAGSWSPVLVVHDEEGVTVHDGQKSYSTGALEVAASSPPPGPGSVGVRIKAATRMHLGVYLTGDSVVASGFSSLLPTDAKYSMSASLGCTPPAPLYVRGVKLDAEQELWVRYIAEHVVSLVPGTPSERLDKSAYVTWWSLKEGVLNVENPLSYSNCSIPPDKHIGPVEVCPDPNNAWQVGLSGVQSTYNTLAGAEAIAQKIYPQKTVTEVLRDAAVTAGLGASTFLGQTVTNSTDRLRISWLLRNGPIGFEAQHKPVYDQCFVGAKAWCFGTGWQSSASFAPTQADAKQSVADLRAIFQSLAP